MANGPHGENCPCTRCVGFQPGHDESTTHGANSEPRVGPIADEYLAKLQRLATDDEAADEFALHRLSRQLARADMVEDYLDKHGWFDEKGVLRPAVKELGTWESSIRKSLAEAGLTRFSRRQLASESLKDYISFAEVQATLMLVMSAGPELVGELTAAGLNGSDLHRAFRRRFPQLVRERVAIQAGGGLDDEEADAGAIIAETDEPIDAAPETEPAAEDGSGV